MSTLRPAALAAPHETFTCHGRPDCHLIGTSPDGIIRAYPGGKYRKRKSRQFKTLAGAQAYLDTLLDA